MAPGVSQRQLGGRTLGNPTARFEPAWPQFNTTAELMSLAPQDFRPE
jgi:hypothetical protein